MSSIKYTLKEVNNIIKQFTTLKSNFIKSHKINIKDNTNILSLFGDNIFTHVEKINKLAQEQNSSISKASKLSSPSMFKKTQPESNISAGKLSLAINQIVEVLKVSILNELKPEKIINETSTFLQFYLQQVLFLTKVKFHFLTFLSNNQQCFMRQQKLLVKQIIIESIKNFFKEKSFFLIIYKLIIEKYDQLKSFQQLQNSLEQYKSYLLRLAAVLYQILYNFTEYQPQKSAHFFVFICSLITNKITKHFSNQINVKKQDKNDKQKNKGFFSFFKKQVKQKDTINKTQTIQKSRSLNRKQKSIQSVSISINEANSISVQEKSQQKRSNKDMTKKQPKSENSLKTSQKSQQIKQQYFLSKDEIEIVQFYSFSLLQKIFTQQTADGASSIMQTYKKVIQVLLKSYISTPSQQAEEENQKSFHDLIEEMILKMIYKDQRLKHQDLLGQQQLKYALKVNYQQLLNRSITILGCVYQFLKNNQNQTINEQNHKKPIQNTNFLLDFVVTLYEKIMMAHKCFIQGEISQAIEFNGKYSFSQNINSHRNLNKQTEHKFNLLYVMNTIAINIISMLYRSPQSLLSQQEKVCELNTLLTLHQIYLNQFNFPNYEAQNQILQSFRERPKQSFRQENQIKNQQQLQFSVDTHHQYIISLQNLKKQLIKTHQNTYGELKRLYGCKGNKRFTKDNNRQASKMSKNSKSKGSQSPGLQQNTPFEQYEQYILSYQNIILESLQQTANQLQETFIGYYKKNKVYLSQNVITLNNSQKTQKMFIYFQKISSHIFNYLSCLMMIFYRNNHGAEARDPFVIKNNVMTSLKLIKILQKIIIFFWQLYWKFNDLSLTLIKSQQRQNQAQNPMLNFIQELNNNFFKLLTKFCIPRLNEKFDYRHMKSCLIISPILDVYQNRLKNYLISQDKFVTKRLKDSKLLIKILLQIIQRASLSTTVQEFQATNIQTKKKLIQNVLQKAIKVLIFPVLNLNKQATISQLSYNQNFKILVQMVFENYSQMKQKIDQQNFSTIGEENFVLNVIKRMLKNINEDIFTVKGNKIEQNKKMLNIDQNQLQKLTVILQMYLVKQQYMIDNQKVKSNICISQQLNQIPLLSMQIFQQIVDFIIKIQLISPKSFKKIIKILNQSKNVDLGFLTKLKDNIIAFKTFLTQQNKQCQFQSQKFRDTFHIQEYMKLFLQFYQKLMTSYILSFTSQKDNSISPSYLLQIGFQIYEILLDLSEMTKSLSIEQLLSLWRMKKSLNLKIKTAHNFKKIRLQILILQNISLNVSTYFSNQIIVNEILQNIFEQQSLLLEKFLKNPKKNTLYLIELIHPYKGTKFFTNLFKILKQCSNDQNEKILLPSEFLELINLSFVSFSSTIKPQKQRRALSNLTTIQTPKFKLQQQQLQQTGLMKRNSIKQKTSLKSMQILQDEQLQCQLSRNMSRNGYKKYGKGIDDSDSGYQQQQRNKQKKQVIVSQLQIQDHQQDNHNNSLVAIEQNTNSIQTISNMGSSSSVCGDIGSSSLVATLNDLDQLVKDKLTVIEQFRLFYHNLLLQLDNFVSGIIMDESSQQQVVVKRQCYEKDLLEMIQNLLTMINQLSKQQVYSLQQKQQQQREQKQQVNDIIKCHITIGYQIKKILAKYIQTKQQCSILSINKNNLTSFESTLQKMCLTCSSQIIDTFQEQDLRLFVQQINQSAKTQKQTILKKVNKQLTLNPIQLNRYFQEKQSNQNQQQSNQLCQNTEISPLFIQYFTLIDNLIFLITDSNNQQNTILSQISQKINNLSQFLMKHHEKITSNHFKQQKNVNQIIQMFDKINSILTVQVWKIDQKMENRLKYYQTIYQIFYPCLVQYIDVSNVAPIVKNILKHNINLKKQQIKQHSKHLQNP